MQELPLPEQNFLKIKNAFLKLALVAVSAASALNDSPADAPPSAALKATLIYVIKPGTSPATIASAIAPAGLPGKGPAQHPFLYAGEWDTRKPLEQSMFIVRVGRMVGESKLDEYIAAMLSGRLDRNPPGVV